MRHLLIIGLVITLGSAGCQYFQQREDAVRVAIARAEGAFLYEDDLEGLVPRNISREDSGKLVEKFINDWVKKQLIMSKARQEITVDEAKIERKVEDYRYALVIHEFEKLYVNSHLDLSVPPEEIEAYYAGRQDNFVLRQNIVRCLFVQVPKSAPDLRQVRRNVRAYPNSNKDDIAQYSMQYGIKTFLDDSIWIDFDEVIAGTPLETVTDKTRFLNNTTYSETSDDDFICFLRIMDYKISNQISPLEFIRNDIENIIISKRKLALKKQLENAIYEEALRENSFEIFDN